MKSYHGCPKSPLLISTLFEIKASTEDTPSAVLIQHHDIRVFRSTTKVYCNEDYKEIKDKHYASPVDLVTLAESSDYARGRE